MNEIALEIAGGESPLLSFDELYRDERHLGSAGKYLAHNLMREALGQTPSEELSAGLDPAVKAYLDSKFTSVTAVPEANASVFVSLLLMTVLFLRWKRSALHVRARQLDLQTVV